MYERASMHRAASYNYPSYAAQPAPKNYPAAHGTSSAYSASANANEDWTKISDLAERRRIQNRIAQRNYRKKLKKRLEDLERRAGSSSASPEQSHEELSQSDTPSSGYKSDRDAQRQRSNSNQSARHRTPEVLNQQYVLPTEDRSMFSQQSTRELSTSPPPFSYSFPPTTDSIGYSSYPQANTYASLYPQYLHPIQHSYAPNAATPQVKQEFYGDDEISPFSMSYASMAGMDMSVGPSYHDASAYPTVPPSLSDYSAGSPRDSTPRTPPMQIYK